MRLGLRCYPCLHLLRPSQCLLAQAAIVGSPFDRQGLNRALRHRGVACHILRDVFGAAGSWTRCRRSWHAAWSDYRGSQRSVLERVSRRDSRPLAQLRPLTRATRCVCARKSVPKTSNVRQRCAALLAPVPLHLERSAYRAKQRSCLPWQCPLEFDNRLHQKCADWLGITLCWLIFGVDTGP